MTITTHPNTEIKTEAAAQGCPVHSTKKTVRAAEPTSQNVEKDAKGVWHVRGYAEAKSILRAAGTKQAGFNAELIDKVSMSESRPILYQEGKAHLLQRKQTARFFTPKATSDHYRGLMVSLSDKMIAELKRSGKADLSKLTMKLAVQVAAEVVGLTSSTIPGLDARLNAFFTEDATKFSWRPDRLLNFLGSQVSVAAFFFLDVKPAIRARKRQPAEDVITHLIEQKYSDGDILTECVTYGAAGMATTREFICVAAWHFLEHPELRAEYLKGDEAARYDILHEILRLEPVIGHLYRRVTEDVQLESKGEAVTIPAGELIDLHIEDINTDESLVTPEPMAVCPHREYPVEGVTPAVMAFGDGAHRCPGAYVAIQESDIFLCKLLALENLKIEHQPTVTWSDLTAGYEVRDFWVAVK
jgi:cytochrome P450